jgi:hypothetical protein
LRLKKSPSVFCKTSGPLAVPTLTEVYSALMVIG